MRNTYRVVGNLEERRKTMARPDLTNEEVEQMGQENPGSAAEYLRL